MPIIDKVNLERTRIGPEWCQQVDGVAVRFVGRLDGATPCSPWPLLPEASRAITPRQVHSASIRVVPPRSSITPADAVATTAPNLALLVITADCVPLLATDGETIVAVHAGWRGIASSVVRRALERLDRDRAWRLWVGPHIGPCCYEVGTEVAERVAAASTREVLLERPGARPHLDLGEAVRSQARMDPDDRLTVVEGCTRCHPEQLHSYRRDGPEAGRNLAVVVVNRES